MAWATEGSIGVEGRRLTFVEAGEGSALPEVVLVHGAGGSQKVWHLLLRRLAGLGLRGVALELPGHGNSAGPGCETIQAYARVVDVFLDTRGGASPILFF